MYFLDNTHPARPQRASGKNGKSLSLKFVQILQLDV
jgi:hypothetical protein